MIATLFYVGMTVVSLLIFLQAGHTLYLALYAWNRPSADSQAPDTFIAPRLSFTVMLPARHEEEVIQTTIDRVAHANYPARLLQIMVVCSADDVGTIGEAQEKIAELRGQGLTNVSVVTFDDLPINKPHGLNKALPQATNHVVTIFDAEDDIHPDIFNVVNTVMVTEKVKVVQAGVQLMDYDSQWYSSLNVLEYFFWFKSRLHYHAHAGAIPLGGNTVFFSRALLVSVGGWDEENLTEDADIGLRLSSMGERVRVVYDDRYVTKEETPPTLQQFIKQRTRWDQGFMQTLKKGTWKLLPTRKQRLLAAYTLIFPYTQAVLGAYFTFSLATMLLGRKTPILVALTSYLPVVMLTANLGMSIVGLYEFTSAHGLKATPKAALRLVLAYLPYQLVLAYAAWRAASRYLRGVSNWEKTRHTGAHRGGSPVAISAGARVAAPAATGVAAPTALAATASEATQRVA
jgi:cellulose synthase/poly-beta-1,6-N-acetylglucosamine synthase-like glycosyltransferase